jgi:hypothetical protein
MTRSATLPGSLLAAFAVITAFACASDAPAPKSLVVGSVIPKATLLDQHEKPHQLDESVKVIFFAREMEGGNVIRSLLDSEGPEFLEKHHALYIADISEMPSLIAKMMALPRMKKRPYPTVLDRDGLVTAAFPSEEGRVTILRLDRLKVTGIEYRGSVEGLRKAARRRSSQPGTAVR